jgi:hypothetical protein
MARHGGAWLRRGRMAGRWPRPPAPQAGDRPLRARKSSDYRGFPPLLPRGPCEGEGAAAAKCCAHATLSRVAGSRRFFPRTRETRGLPGRCGRSGRGTAAGTLLPRVRDPESAKRMGLTQSHQSQQSFLVPLDMLWSGSGFADRAQLQCRYAVPAGSAPDFSRGCGNGRRREARQDAMRIFSRWMRNAGRSPRRTGTRRPRP